MDLEKQFPHLDPALIAALSLDGTPDLDMLAALNADAMVEELEKQEHAKWENLSNDRENKDGPTEEFEYEDEFRFLKQSFPKLGDAIIRRKLQKCDGDIQKATDELLNSQIIDELDLEVYQQGAREYTQLSKKHRKNQRATLRKEQLQQAKVKEIEFLAVTMDVEYTEAERLYDKHGSAGNVIVKFNERFHKPLDPEDATTVLRPVTPISRSAWSPSSSSHSSHSSITDARDKRDQAVEQMQEMLRKSKSNPLYRSAAGVYGTRAKDITLDIDNQYTKHIESQSSDFYIDCHGTPSAIAVEYVAERLHEWKLNGCRRPFEVITGSGKHSAGGVPKTKNMVRKRLDMARYEYSEHPAGFIVEK